MKLVDIVLLLIFLQVVVALPALAWIEGDFVKVWEEDEEVVLFIQTTPPLALITSLSQEIETGKKGYKLIDKGTFQQGSKLPVGVHFFKISAPGYKYQLFRFDLATPGKKIIAAKALVPQVAPSQRIKDKGEKSIETQRGEGRNCSYRFTSGSWVEKESTMVYKPGAKKYVCLD